MLAWPSPAFSAPLALSPPLQVKPGIYRDLLIPLQDVPDRSQLLSTQIAWEMKRANYLVILVPSSHFLYFWHSIGTRLSRGATRLVLSPLPRPPG